MEESHSSKPRRIKVCTVQINPIHGKIHESMQAADKLLAKYSEADKLDVLLLPEMPFTGYIFKSKDEVRPYVETAGEGATFDWCAQKAKELNGYVFCGYPEVLDDKMYNSQLVVSREGKFIKSYKKAYLCPKDYPWAEEGPGFETTDIINNDGCVIKIGNGIGMDILPRFLEAPILHYEFATFHADNDSDIILFSSSWGDSNIFSSDEDLINFTIDEWRTSLKSFFNNEKSRQGDKRYFVCSNRIGNEGGYPFYGCSGILEKDDSVSEVCSTATIIN